MRILAMLAAMATAAAAAEPIETALLPDTSGRARLVLAHWPERGWVVGQQGRRVEIRFPAAELDIDLGSLGSSSPELARLQAHTRIERGETLLRLDLGCDCGVALTGDGEARLAIDIVGAGLPPGPVLRAQGPAPARAPRPTARNASRVALPPLPDDLPSDLAATRERLLSQLERAAEAGLITLQGDPARPSPPPPSADPDEPALMQADGGRPSEAAAPPRIPHDLAPIAPGTSSTRPIPDAPRIAHTATDEPECADPELFELTDSLGADRFVEELGQLRSGLLGEFDRPDPGVAHRLARFYISHGLGAEARAVLAEFADEEAGTAQLVGMAHIVDDDPGAPLAALKDGCTGPQLAWQALAEAGEGDISLLRDHGAEIRSTLEGFPDRWRDAFAVRLGIAAAHGGNWTAARAFHAMARWGDRAGTSQSAPRRLLEALIARESGQPAAALAELRAIWATGGPDAEAALLAIADMVLSEELPGAADTHLLRLDLGAVAHLERGTGRGRAAFLAEAKLRAAALGLASALDLLALGRDWGHIDEATHSQVTASLVGEAPRQDTGEPLALLYSQAPARYSAALNEPGFRTALARSFLDIGLPRRAEAVLESADLTDPSLTLDLARAYVQSGSGDDALRFAAALPASKARAEVEAAALEALGNPAEALAKLLAADAGLPKDIARLAWAAEDWPQAAKSLAEINALSEDPEIAARLALAAQRAGLPSPARATDSEDGRAAQAFAGLSPPAPKIEATTEDVGRFLEDLRAETAAMREMLTDG